MGQVLWPCWAWTRRSGELLWTETGAAAGEGLWHYLQLGYGHVKREMPVTSPEADYDQVVSCPTLWKPGRTAFMESGRNSVLSKEEGAQAISCRSDHQTVVQLGQVSGVWLGKNNLRSFTRGRTLAASHWEKSKNDKESRASEGCSWRNTVCNAFSVHETLPLRQGLFCRVWSSFTSLQPLPHYRAKS